MLSYRIKPEDLTLSVVGRTKDSPLTLSANPYTIETHKPLGFLAIEGNVYSASPEGLPVLLVYEDGGAEIRTEYSILDVANARFVVSGSAMLIEHREKIKKPSPLNLRAAVPMPRMGVGTLTTGELIFLVVEGTLDDLYKAFAFYKIYDAMMLSYNDIYVRDTLGGIMMGTQPITVLEAKTFKAMAKPVVVLDAGHGGTDPGAIGFGKHEADVNLMMAKAMQKYLTDHYNGTFLLVRDTDATIELNDRPKMAKAINADFYFSTHTNAFSDPSANGYESFTYLGSDARVKTSDEIRSVVHDTVMHFLSPYGITDRGKKKANLCVVRENKCPAMLVENLFITNPQNNKLLTDAAFCRQLAEKTAEGIAKGMKLTKKLTTSQPEATPDVLYSVQVGAFAYKKGAEETLTRLKQAGFNGIIVSKNIKKE